MKNWRASEELMKELRSLYQGLPMARQALDKGDITGAPPPPPPPPPCRHPPQSGAATTSQSKVKTATTVSATSACRRSNPRCWRGRMTLSWHTGYKADGLLLLAVPAAITRVTLSRSSPDEGPLSDVIRQVGLGRIEPGRGPVHLPGQQVVERGRQGVIAMNRRRQTAAAGTHPGTSERAAARDLGRVAAL